MAIFGTVVPGETFGFRNRIINGDMRIDQRNANASVSITSTDVYTIDRWKVQNATDGTLTTQQVVDAPAGFYNSVKFTVGTADSSLSSGQLARMWQVVEANNVDDFSLGTASAVAMSISFWVKSSLTGTFGGNLCGGTSLATSYVFTYTINSANTWEYKTITIPGATVGTWFAGNNAGIALVFDLGTGSNFQKAAGSWGTGQYAQGTSTSVPLIGTAGATMNITGVQLEVGSVATPFERRPYGLEFSLCQRYYQIFYPTAQELIYIESNAATQKWWSFTIPEPMRTTPSVTASAGMTGGTVAGLAGVTISSLTLEGSSLNRISFRVNMSGTGGTAYNIAHTDNFSGDSVALSAEL